MNYTDFTDSPFYTSTGNTYPQYCCNLTSSIFPCRGSDANQSVPQQSSGFILTLRETNVIFYFISFFLEMVEGCYIKLLTAIEENAIIIAGVAIGIAAIEVHQTFYLAYLENIGKGDARLMFQESFFFILLTHVCETRGLFLQVRRSVSS